MEKIADSYQSDLVSFAFASAAEDADLSREAKQILLQKIEGLLTEHLFSPTHYPELIFLQERIQRLEGKSETISKQIERMTKSFSDPEEGTFGVVALLALKIEKTQPNDKMFALYQQSMGTKFKLFVKQKNCPVHIERLFKEFLDHKPQISWARFIKMVRTLPLNPTTTLKDLKKQQMIRDLENQGIDAHKLSQERAPKSFSKVLLNLVKCLTPDMSTDTIFEERIINLLMRIKFDCVNKIKNPIQIMSKNELLKITNLHLAVLLRHEEAVQELLKNGYSPNEGDSQGYTSAHFAAFFPDFKLLLLLNEYGADFYLKNQQGATVFDLIKARGFAKIDLDQKMEFFKGEQITLREAENRLNRKFYPANVYTADALHKIWFLPRIETELTCDAKAAEAAYLQSKQTAPLYLRKCEEGPLKDQMEACASKVINAGDFFVEYTGEVLPETVGKMMRYAVTLDSRGEFILDAEKGGSFAAIMNHGPPSCRFHIIMHKGTYRCIFYALRKILPDEPLYWNYGPYYFQYETAQVLAPKMIEQFIHETKGLTDLAPFIVSAQNQVYYNLKIKNGKIQTLELPIKDQKELMEKMLRYRFIFGMLEYVLNSGSLLQKLIREDQIKKKDLKQLLEFFKHSKIWDQLEVDDKVYEEIMKL